MGDVNEGAGGKWVLGLINVVGCFFFPLGWEYLCTFQWNGNEGEELQKGSVSIEHWDEEGGRGEFWGFGSISEIASAIASGIQE